MAIGGIVRFGEVNAMLTIPAPLVCELDRFDQDVRVWPANDQRLTERRNLDEAVALAVHLYNRLMRHHQEWASRVDGQVEAFEMEKAEAFERGFQTWVAAARSLHKRVKILEKEGFFIEQAGELRMCIQRCPYEGISIRQLVEGAEELKQGKGISLGELRDEIRRKADAAGR